MIVFFFGLFLLLKFIQFSARASVVVAFSRHPAVQVGGLEREAGRVLPFRHGLDPWNVSQQTEMLSEDLLQVNTSPITYYSSDC